jgi:hypothetical protein
MPSSSWRDDEKWLIAWLKATDPTKGNFQDFCAAIVGLARSGTDESRAQVRARIDILFDEKFQRRTDWSWYHFAWETSWALIALSASSSASRVVLSTPELLTLLAEADRAANELDKASEAYIDKATGRSFSWIIAWSVAAGIVLTVAVVASVFIFQAGDAFWATLGNLSLVWGPAGGVLAFCVGRLYVIKKELASVMG